MLPDLVVWIKEVLSSGVLSPRQVITASIVRGADLHFAECHAVPPAAKASTPSLHRHHTMDLELACTTWRCPVLRAILLTPGTPDPRAAYGYDHARGLSDMAATAWRTAPIAVIATVLFVILVVFCLWYLVRKVFKKRVATRNALQA